MSPQHRNDVAIIVRLPGDLRDELAARAAVEDRSMASLMRVAAKSYLEHNPEAMAAGR